MTQKALVLALLKERGEAGVSAREAIYDLHITRLAAIIFDLRQEGHPIRAEQKKGETARYFLDATRPRPRGSLRCRCGHQERQHISGMRCLAETGHLMTSVTYCDCQRFAEVSDG